MKANEFWVRANINVYKAQSAFDFCSYVVVPVVPGPVESRKDCLGPTCRQRCPDPAAYEPCAPHRTVSVNNKVCAGGLCLLEE